MIKNRIQHQREEVQDHQSTQENLKIPVRNRLSRKGIYKALRVLPNCFKFNTLNGVLSNSQIINEFHEQFHQ